MSRSSEKTNNEGPGNRVPRDKAISPCRYSFQIQQHLAESEKCHNANAGKIKLEERSTFRRCLSLISKSNTSSFMILLLIYLSKNHTLHSEEMISENV